VSEDGWSLHDRYRCSHLLSSSSVSPTKQAGNGLRGMPCPSRPGSVQKSVVAVAVEEAEAAGMLAH
jgi:hypothetical protein